MFPFNRVIFLHAYIIFSEFRDLLGTKSTRERNVFKYLDSIINYIQISLLNDVTNQFVYVNPDDNSNFYFLQSPKTT